jgi:hypothetical protein
MTLIFSYEITNAFRRNATCANSTLPDSGRKARVMTGCQLISPGFDRGILNRLAVALSLDFRHSKKTMLSLHHGDIPTLMQQK